MRPLELHPLALAESEAAAVWYAERDPRVAARFVQELDVTLGLIVEAPDRWPIYLGVRRATGKTGDGVPPKPMMPSAPTSLTNHAPDSLRRHTGRPSCLIGDL